MTANDQEPADWRDLIDQLSAEQVHLLEKMETELDNPKFDPVLLDLALRKARWNIADAVHFGHLDPPVGERSLESEDGGDQVMSTGWLTDIGQTDDGEWYREFTCDGHAVREWVHRSPCGDQPYGVPSRPMKSNRNSSPLTEPVGLLPSLLKLPTI